ncbi:MAG: phosphatase [Defluviitaleaceae bacterium]|nr:phosphatase [Defluviitaleaceae bacterium]
MNFILDVHCHTIASGHAYSTVSENAVHAASIGLTHIAITDHGPAMPGGAHLYAFANQSCLPDYIHGVRVLKSAEVNITNNDGNLDLHEGLLRKMDFTIASLHRGVCPPNTKPINTNTLIKAMENPLVSILGHPCDFHFDIDIEAVVAAAANTGTIIEINNQTLNPDSIRYDGDAKQRQLIALCKDYKVPVIAGSDAHFWSLVGDVSQAKALIEEAGLPESQVLNTSADLFFSVIRQKRGQQ